MAAFVVLVNVPVLNDEASVPEANPERPAATGVDQLYVVLAGTSFVPVKSEAVKVTLPPLQMAEGVWARIDGFGFTVTVTVNVEPAQVPAVGVTVYVAVCAELVVLVSVWLMEDWPVAWALPPVILAALLLITGADQV